MWKLDDHIDRYIQRKNRTTTNTRHGHCRHCSFLQADVLRSTTLNLTSMASFFGAGLMRGYRAQKANTISRSLADVAEKRSSFRCSLRIAGPTPSTALACTSAVNSSLCASIFRAATNNALRKLLPSAVLTQAARQLH